MGVIIKFGTKFTSSKLFAKIALKSQSKAKVIEVRIIKNENKIKLFIEISIKNKLAKITNPQTIIQRVIQAKIYATIILFVVIGETKISSILLNIFAEKNQNEVIE